MNNRRYRQKAVSFRKEFYLYIEQKIPLFNYIRASICWHGLRGGRFEQVRYLKARTTGLVSAERSEYNTAGSERTF